MLIAQRISDLTCYLCEKPLLQNGQTDAFFVISGLDNEDLEVVKDEFLTVQSNVSVQHACVECGESTQGMAQMLEEI